jgi:hypothetical protein
MNASLADVSEQLHVIRKKLRRAKKDAQARQQRAEQAGRATTVWWTVLAAFYTSDGSFELAAQCWCQQRQAHHCCAEQVSQTKALQVVRKWVDAVTPADLNEISNPSTPKIERAVSRGIKFVKQAGMAIWVLDHNRKRGHAPTTAQLLEEWGTPAFERTAIADTDSHARCALARHRKQASRWRAQWFARFGRIRVREHLPVDNMRQKVRRPVAQTLEQTVLFLSPHSAPQISTDTT